MYLQDGACWSPNNLYLELLRLVESYPGELVSTLQEPFTKAGHQRHLLSPILTRELNPVRPHPPVIVYLLGVIERPELTIDSTVFILPLTLTSGPTFLSALGEYVTSHLVTFSKHVGQSKRTRPTFT